MTQRQLHSKPFHWLAVVSLAAMVVLIAFAGCTHKGQKPAYNRTTSDVEPIPRKSEVIPPVYIVRSGDTLISIAWRYGLDFKSVAAWNSIKQPDYAIYPGQRLVLKPVRSPTTAKAKSRKATQSTTTIKKVEAPAKQQTSKTKKQQTALPQPTPSAKMNWRWPTKGKVIKSFSRSSNTRKGIVISGVKDQPVVAAEGGQVVYSGSGLIGYGNLIILKHDDNYLSAYGFNRQLYAREGDSVRRGERIATMGAPREGEPPQLHFEIRKQGEPVNPLSYLPKL